MIIVLVALSFGGIGFFIGDSRMGDYNPYWENVSLATPPINITKIEHIEIISTLPDPIGDIVYVSNKDGIVYSNTLFQSSWSAVAPVPVWDNDYASDCATEKDNPSDSHMWDNPPIENGVIDSASFRFERPVSTIVRCYVLLDNGNLEVWTHSGNAMDLMAHNFIKLMYGVFGALIGAIIGIVILRARNRAIISTG